ncbi:hypothetical protein ABVC46_10630 [Lactobacillus crispatus]|nr:hypothetical protein [Lactobacillus crispatus]MCT7672875.1 hypothetical protein [Lactobacillus crispatus]MCT7687026.1 hypothetical protein [Lactobacillus crispatus]MCT7694576.1 hypothetical protein [Lactobacillus crispatus]MCT7696830.1 hypothetical protein [Lactobacillus crispatus]MCT7701372.1 hypothetical protein [Lactobacillus crispatus]
MVGKVRIPAADRGFKVTRVHLGKLGLGWQALHLDVDLLAKS